MANPKHIALVCPGGPITQDLANQVGEIAAARFGDGVELHFHPQCFLEAGHFAGADAQRSAAFLEAANDPQYDAVWFARGGYGACRLDDTVYDRLDENARRKTYLGYSDAGFILARLYRLGVGRPVHGPMAMDLVHAGGEKAVARALDFLVDDDPAALEPTATGGEKTAAFNITVLGHFINADWAPDLSDHVVMLEDVGEYHYRIDRSMFTVMTAPNMRRAKGVKLGRISQVPENDRPFGANEEEIAQYWCSRAGVSYFGRADIGHDGDNKIVPFGAAASIGAA